MLPLYTTRLRIYCLTVQLVVSAKRALPNPLAVQNNFAIVDAIFMVQYPSKIPESSQQNSKSSYDSFQYILGQPILFNTILSDSDHACISNCRFYEPSRVVAAFHKSK